MPYTVKIPGAIGEVIADSTGEVIALLDALQPPMPRAPSTPAPPKRSKEEKGENVGTSARGRRLMPMWLEIFRMLAAAQNGIPAQEVSHRLGLAKMNGLGRATVPIKRMLSERGIAPWEEVVTKARGEDGVTWRAGPKIGQAIEIVEGESRPG